MIEVQQNAAQQTQPETPQTATLPLTPQTIKRLREVPILASLTEERLHCLDGTQTRTMEAGELLIRQGEVVHSFCILLDGRLRLFQTNRDGHELLMHVHEAGASFGELPLLANIPSTVTVRAESHAEVLILDEEQFWNLMVTCPEVRKQILGNMAMRLQKMQSVSFQQEKLASLGTMAAGLMHELNNPGAAARRAASQLRDNLTRMQRLSSKFTRQPLNMEQKECMMELQECAFSAKEKVALSSIEQSDAEEALAEWMEQANVEDAWKLAPSLIAMGINSEELKCAYSVFPGEMFGDAVSWLEALVSSMALVATIEESIGRVTDLVAAVKSYAYEGRGQRQTIDVNKSIHATLVVLGHKLREKQLVLQKSLAPDLPLLETECQGLNQIWTNLLDNAIDASAQMGAIGIRTWTDEVDTDSGDKRSDLCIAIKDYGSGIPLESQQHIFDPFYTTKPVGVGTGLGLGIVYRIVEQYGGVIRFSSVPGETEFVVRLPAKRG
jgi:signal transduction histidine kinase